jgi:NADPH2:quinone reductase
LREKRASMHRIVVEETGGPDKLLYVDRPEPVPGPGQVAVRIGLTSVNFADIQARRGTGVTKTPFTPGLDGMGTVLAVGPNVTRVKPGQRVAVNPDDGSYADVVLAREELVFPVSDAISDEAAASVTVLVTAWNILQMVARIQPDETVLIHAAAGGVGSVLVQMAKALDVKRIFATAGSDEKLAIARGFGADVAIDYTKDDFAKIVSDETNGRGVDVICDAIGGDVFAKGLGVLAPFGRHVVYGQSGGSHGSLTTDLLHRTNRAVLGYSSGHYRRNRPLKLHSAVEGAFALVAAGKVKILEGGRFALKDAGQAHQLVESRASTGRVFLTP